MKFFDAIKAKISAWKAKSERKEDPKIAVAIPELKEIRERNQKLGGAFGGSNAGAKLARKCRTFWRTHKPSKAWIEKRRADGAKITAIA